MNTQELIAQIPASDAAFYDWIDWHSSIKRRYGKKRARQLFYKAWTQRSNRQANNEQLRTYLQKEGINIEADWEDKTLDFVSDPLGIFSLVGSTVSSVKYGLIAALVIVLLVAALLLYNIAKDPNATLKAAMAMRTGGLVK